MLQELARAPGADVRVIMAVVTDHRPITRDNAVAAHVMLKRSAGRVGGRALTGQELHSGHRKKKKSCFAWGVRFPTMGLGPGGEIGRRKGLKRLSTQLGNGWCEWSQIRGNLDPCGWWRSRAKTEYRKIPGLGKV